MNVLTICPQSVVPEPTTYLPFSRCLVLSLLQPEGNQEKLFPQDDRPTDRRRHKKNLIFSSSLNFAFKFIATHFGSLFVFPPILRPMSVSIQPRCCSNQTVHPPCKKANPRSTANTPATIVFLGSSVGRCRTLSTPQLKLS